MTDRTEGDVLGMVIIQLCVKFGVAACLFLGQPLRLARDEPGGRVVAAETVCLGWAYLNATHVIPTIWGYTVLISPASVKEPGPVNGHLKISSTADLIWRVIV